MIAEFDNSGLGFPIQKLILGKEAFEYFTNPEDQITNSDFVAYILTRKVTDFLEGTQAKVEVKNGEVLFESNSPPLELVNRCDATVRVSKSAVRGVVSRSSVLRAGGSTDANFFDASSPLRTSINIGGDVDLKAYVYTSGFVRFGKFLFGKCITKFERYLPLSLAARGKASVNAKIAISGIRLVRLLPEQVPKPPFQRQTYTSNNSKFYSHIHFTKPITRENYYLLANSQSQLYPALAKRTGIIQQGIDTIVKFNNDFNEEAKRRKGTVPYLVFKLKILLDADIHYFVVDKVGLKNCDINFLGVKLFSFCGIVRDAVKENIEQFARRFNALTAPRLIKEFERILHYRLGDEIYIPLYVADEKSLALASIIEQADEIAKLKADLGSDLADLTSQVADASENLVRDLTEATEV